MEFRIVKIPRIIHLCSHECRDKFDPEQFNMIIPAVIVGAFFPDKKKSTINR